MTITRIVFVKVAGKTDDKYLTVEAWNNVKIT